MGTYTISRRQVPLDDSWDVIVVGGGPAGCAAATASAREGARTLLVEASGALGGMGTLGLVPWICGYGDGEQDIARGLAGRVHTGLRDGMPHTHKSSPWGPAIAPELLKRIYDDMVTESGAVPLFHTQLCAVERADDGSVDTLLVSNKAGISAYRAAAYVDCTGDGDLSAWAGAEFEKGDETGALQPATHCFQITNIDKYGLASGPDIHFFDPESPVHKAVKSEEYPLIVDLHSCNTQVGPGTYGYNTGHIFNVDNTDPANISKALVHGRKQAAQYHAAFKSFHPAFANSYLVATGALMGVRETRRIVGDYMLTLDDYLARRSFPDEICRNAYNIDIHPPFDPMAPDRSIDELKHDNAEAIKQLGAGESYGVPYRCLTPRGIKNLLVAGRCISTDRPTNGSVRIMACCLTTGEAAGIAAAMSAASPQKDVHTIDICYLRGRLRRHGAYLP
jgi:hypothetical protein